MSSPIIDIKDLLLSNAQDEYQQLTEKISSQISEKVFSSDFQIDISSDKVINYVNTHSKRLIVLGEPNSKEAPLKAALKEINSFLKKTSCSVLVVPEKAAIEFPKNAQVISNLSSLNVLELLKEQLSFKPEQLRIVSLTDGLSEEPLTDRGRLCQKVRDKYFRFLSECYEESNSDIVILVTDVLGAVPPLEMQCLYELCINTFHVPLFIINPKLTSA